MEYQTLRPNPLVIHVSDPEDYATILRPNGAQVTITEAGEFSASFAKFELGRAWMQAGVEIRPRILEGAIKTDRHGIGLQLSPGPNFYSCGAEVGPDDLAIYNGLHRDVCQRTTGPTSWASTSLPWEIWETVGGVMAGHSPDFSEFQPVISPTAEALGSLRRVLQSIVHLCAHSPELLQNQEVARGLDNALIHAAVTCALPPSDNRAPKGPVRHACIIRRFRDVISKSFDQPLYLTEVCLALRVSERTLRQCCQEYFGMGPKRYLLLHRLHLARRALLLADLRKDSVTAIATRFGFWELGRFSVAYRTLFGETPVATLRCGAGMAVATPGWQYAVSA